MKQPIDRRTLLLSGLGTAAMVASGCATRSRRTADATLPSPVWPHQRPGAAPSRPTAPTAADSTGLRRVAIVPRTNWTAAQPNLWNTNQMAGIRAITVHHDGMAPVPLNTTSQTADRLELIRRVHVEQNKWADIGYHFVIDPRGTIWAARPLHLQGAHVKNHNEHNMGILVLGNFEQQVPTSQALGSLDSLIAEAAAVNKVPLARVKTHREWNPTACPGASLQRYMNTTRSRSGRIGKVLA